MKKSTAIIIAIEIIIISILFFIYMMLYYQSRPSGLVEEVISYDNSLANNMINVEWSNDTIELNLNDFD